MSSPNTTPRTPTTTHDAWGAGDPHLRVTREGERFEYALQDDAVRIGSAADAELRLEGADPLHATILHDERDEYVLTMHGEGETNAASQDDDGRPTEILRTGSRFTIGAWTLVYGRAESADHGRPFGGRQGGELSDQPLQPSRPDYVGETPQGDASHPGESRPVDADIPLDGDDDTPLTPEHPESANASGQGGSAGGAHRSSTTERLAGDRQGATAPDEDGDPEEPWS
ncbi:FHA domain-containing protein [Microbacterium tumbae]